jgi:uncharacterized protein (DUF3084 family)
MSNIHRTSLAFAAGCFVAILAVGAARTPTMAADDLTALREHQAKLESVMNQLSSKVDDLANQLRKMRGESGPGGAKALEGKVAQLEKQVAQLNAHTHDYFQEGRTADGGTMAVRPEEFTSRGLTATGISRIGKPVMR